MSSSAPDRRGDQVAPHAHPAAREELAAARRREQRLVKELAMYRGALDALPESINIRDAEHQMVYANPRALEAMGLGEQAEIERAERKWRYVLESGQPPRPEDFPTWRALHGEGLSRARGLLIDEYLNRRVWLEATAAPIVDEHDQIIGVVNLVRDITAERANEEALAQRTAELRERAAQLTDSLVRLRAAQEQLVESAKMAALGELVAGVAHEINTPVGVGVTAASTLRDRTERVAAEYRRGAMTRSTLEKYLEIATQSTSMILTNLRRASELIEGFKQVAVDQSYEELRGFGVQDYVSKILLSLRHKLKGERHAVQIAVEPELTIRSYPGALAQVVTNLLVNAFVHAFDAGVCGHIEIRFERADDQHIAFTFRDDGRGISPRHLPHIFEPFFTTRRGQGGTGLGLHIVYNIVTQKLGGTIRCESAVGRGACFYIRLPAVTPTQARAHARYPDAG